MAQHSGWYEDPYDPTQLRYWDGVLWTSNTVPRVSPTAQQSTIGRAVPGQPAPVQPGPVQPGPSAGGRPGPGQSDAGASGPGAQQPPSGQGYGQQGRPPYAQPGYGQYSGPGQQPYSAPPVQGYAGSPWAQAGKVAPDGTPLALWWQRLLARIVDSLLLSVVTFIVASSWIGPLLNAMETYFKAAMDSAQSGGTPPSSLQFEEQITAYLVPIAVISVVISLLYETTFLMWRGATVGKLLFGIRVRRVADPGRLGLVTALRRQVITVGVSAVALVPVISTVGTMVQLLDYAWLLWDPRRQCLHDKVADTLVVKTR